MLLSFHNIAYKKEEHEKLMNENGANNELIINILANTLWTAFSHFKLLFISLVSFSLSGC